MTRIEIDHSAGSMEKKIRIETEDELTSELVAELFMEERVRSARDLIVSINNTNTPISMLDRILEKVGIY